VSGVQKPDCPAIGIYAKVLQYRPFAELRLLSWRVLAGDGADCRARERRDEADAQALRHRLKQPGAPAGNKGTSGSSAAVQPALPAHRDGLTRWRSRANLPAFSASRLLDGQRGRCGRQPGGKSRCGPAAP
jgi:hypothetical protein